MDATKHKNNLEFSNFCHNSHITKDRIFEKSGKINKVWALSIFFNPEVSIIVVTNPIQAGLLKPVYVYY